jgi:hypothetical protein
VKEKRAQSPFFVIGIDMSSSHGLAQFPSEAKTLVCVEQNEKEVGKCQYNNTGSSFAPVSTALTRQSIDSIVTLANNGSINSQMSQHGQFSKVISRIFL